MMGDCIYHACSNLLSSLIIWMYANSPNVNFLLSILMYWIPNTDYRLAAYYSAFSAILSLAWATSFFPQSVTEQGIANPPLTRGGRSCLQLPHVISISHPFVPKCQNKRLTSLGRGDFMNLKSCHCCVVIMKLCWFTCSRKSRLPRRSWRC